MGVHPRSVVLKKDSVLDDIWKIPIRTLLSAMRIASKYDMEDIKMAITRIITNMTSAGIGQAIERLAFMAEFSTHFSVSLAGDIFLQACSISSTPSANDLKPLMAQPRLMAAMIKNREGMLRGQLEQELRVQTRSPHHSSWCSPPRAPTRLPRSPRSPPPRSPSPVPRLEAWILEELNSFGFSK